MDTQNFAWTHEICRDAALRLDKVVELVSRGSVIRLSSLVLKANTTKLRVEYFDRI